MSTPQTSSNGPGLKRVLGLSSLVLYGIILIQPTAPMPLFGAAVGLAKGPCCNDHTHRDGRNDVYCNKLRENGQCLSQCRFCIYLCKP